MIEPVPPTKAEKTPAALLEEGQHLRQRLECFHAITGIIAPARMRPARIAFLGARPKRNHVGAPLRPAGAPQGDVEWKQDFVESCH